MSNILPVCGVNRPIYFLIKDVYRGVLFYEPSDIHFMIKTLKKFSTLFGIKLHAYVIMDNYMRILITSPYAIEINNALGLFMAEYTDYFNKTYRRISKLLELECSAHSNGKVGHLLALYRYIELSPVWGGIVNHPAEYPWSSYGCNALGENTGLITPHEQYLSLADNDDMRRRAYRDLFAQDTI